ncbi:MAG TPA: efflux RND transporter periplasmic adaptor subunit [Acidobacteriota bacterium]|nr:efflux RND transporter periplasmic adaptor subunit [Acidobacteriota bacterium]
MRLRVKVYGFLALVALLAIGGYLAYQMKSGTAQASNQAAEPGKKPGQDTAVPVELAEAVSGQISSFLVSTTNLRALRDVDVASQIEGVVKSIEAEEGDFVEAGEVLCRLDDTQLKIRLQTAEQRLAQARLQLEKGRVRQEKTEVQIKNGREDLERYKRLYEDKLVSVRDVALLEYKVEELEHDQRVSSSETRELSHRVEELEAEIAQVNLEISRTLIRAPFSGYIVERMVDLGQVVRNLAPVFKLSDFSPLFADVHLAETEAGQVRPNQSAIIRLGSKLSEQVPAHVARISPVVDQSSGTVKVTVEMKKAQGAFKPGAFVRVEIKTDTRENAVLIPKRAVLEEDGQHFVYVAEKDNANRVAVDLGYQRDDQVEVLTGLKPGQQVVVAGQGALKKGSKIRVIKG